jgi:hypothetical protein
MELIAVKKNSETISTLPLRVMTVSLATILTVYGMIAVVYSDGNVGYALSLLGLVVGGKKELLSFSARDLKFSRKGYVHSVPVGTSTRNS